jgi:Kef-type K+ transport system membrane component KefB
MSPTPTTPTTFAGLVDFFIGIINSLILVLFALAFLVLIWKLIDTWIIHADDDKKREEGRTIAITAVLVMVVMVSIWGILSLLQNSVF